MIKASLAPNNCSPRGRSEQSSVCRAPLGDSVGCGSPGKGALIRWALRLGKSKRADSRSRRALVSINTMFESRQNRVRLCVMPRGNKVGHGRHGHVGGLG